MAWIAFEWICISLIAPTARFYIFSMTIPAPCKEVSVADLKALIDAGFANCYLYDTRKPEDFAQYHIAQAVSFTVDGFFEDMNSFDEETKVFVICYKGVSSVGAVLQLEKVDHDAQLYSVAGGMNAWLEAGYPVVS